MKTKNALVISFDFDETISLYKKSSKTKFYKPKEVINGIPNKRIVKLIKKLRSQGHRVVIDSSRHWSDYNSIVQWLKIHKIKVDSILLGRFKSDCFIDDKSVFSHENNLEEKVYDMLENHSNWGRWVKE